MKSAYFFGILSLVLGVSAASAQTPAAQPECSLDGMTAGEDRIVELVRSCFVAVMNRNLELANKVSLLEARLGGVEENVRPLSWTPLPEGSGNTTLLADFPEKEGQTVSREIPSSVPGNAKEIFVFVGAMTRGGAADSGALFKIFTERQDKGGNKIENYVMFLYQSYSSNPQHIDYASNSQTFWLPVNQSNRRIYVQRTLGDEPLGMQGGARLTVLGYR